MFFYSYVPPYLGLKAKTVSALKPTGFIQLQNKNGKILDARSRYEFIGKGTMVEIIAKDFSGVWVVKPLQPKL